MGKEEQKKIHVIFHDIEHPFADGIKDALTVGSKIKIPDGFIVNSSSENLAPESKAKSLGAAAANEQEDQENNETREASRQILERLKVELKQIISDDEAEIAKKDEHTDAGSLLEKLNSVGKGCHLFEEDELELERLVEESKKEILEKIKAAKSGETKAEEGESGGKMEENGSVENYTLKDRKEYIRKAVHTRTLKLEEIFENSSGRSISEAKSEIDRIGSVDVHLDNLSDDERKEAEEYLLKMNGVLMRKKEKILKGLSKSLEKQNEADKLPDEKHDVNEGEQHGSENSSEKLDKSEIWQIFNEIFNKDGVIFGALSKKNKEFLRKAHVYGMISRLRERFEAHAENSEETLNGSGDYREAIKKYCSDKTNLEAIPSHSSQKQQLVEAISKAVELFNVLSAVKEENGGHVDNAGSVEEKDLTKQEDGKGDKTEENKTEESKSEEPPKDNGSKDDIEEVAVVSQDGAKTEPSEPLEEFLDLDEKDIVKDDSEEEASESGGHLVASEVGQSTSDIPEIVLEKKEEEKIVTLSEEDKKAFDPSKIIEIEPAGRKNFEAIIAIIENELNDARGEYVEIEHKKEHGYRGIFKGLGIRGFSNARNDEEVIRFRDAYVRKKEQMRDILAEKFNDENLEQEEIDEKISIFFFEEDCRLEKERIDFRAKDLDVEIPKGFDWEKIKYDLYRNMLRVGLAGVFVHAMSWMYGLNDKEDGEAIIKKDKERPVISASRDPRANTSKKESDMENKMRLEKEKKKGTPEFSLGKSADSDRNPSSTEKLDGKNYRARQMKFFSERMVEGPEKYDQFKREFASATSDINRRIFDSNKDLFVEMKGFRIYGQEDVFMDRLGDKGKIVVRELLKKHPPEQGMTMEEWVKDIVIGTME